MLDLNNLFSLLQTKGESKRLSDYTGISTGNISDWKSGRSKPSAETLVKIADYVNYLRC
uniref:Helix-turn-helix domain protein n=1 Tax=Siphoviridae sp. ctZd434 TaxID=2825559 RepID=A0A8S5UH95_9CAUD|nr:MAG TPA: helix-turn-helix domain protein [Siphoviridae sp. ctZd434]